MHSRDAWRAYRKLRRIVWGGVATLLGALVLGGLIQQRWGPGSDVVVAPFIIGGFVAWGVAAFRAGRFHCPRCGKRFFMRPTRWGSTFANPYARRCLNCGLPKWSSGSAHAHAG